MAKRTEVSQWERKCPKCDNPIFYKHEWTLRKAITKGAPCRACHCRNVGKKYGVDGSIRKGRVMTEVTRQKLREYRIKQIEALGGKNGFNPDACLMFEYINEVYGLNGRHAENGGEVQVIGFKLDFYDKKHNLVIEWDEYHHRRKGHREKDAIRQQKITDHLGCKFIRFDDDCKITEIEDKMEKAGFHVKNPFGVVSIWE